MDKLETYDWIKLKPLSRQILEYTAVHEPQKAQEIAEGLTNVTTRQVDAAVTKSLVRHSLVVREAKLTKVLKKEYNLIRITDRGKRYLKWLHEKENGGI